MIAKNFLSKKCLIKRMSSKLDRCLEASKKRDDCQIIFKYVLSLIDFRISLEKEGGLEDEKSRKLDRVGDELLEYFSKEKMKALNLAVVYQDFESQKIRRLKDLKELKRKIETKK